jgi:hypothetical protein
MFLNERYSMLAKQIIFNKNKLINNLKYLFYTYMFDINSNLLCPAVIKGIK